MLSTRHTVELPDRIAHGFLEITGLKSAELGKVLCYQFDKFHTGITLYSPDEMTSIFMQMYMLPDGEIKLHEDLEFQINRRNWGKIPKVIPSSLQIFPATWAHSIPFLGPDRVIHLYRGPKQALFTRYFGRSLQEPLFTKIDQSTRYLAESWHTDLVNWDMEAHAAPNLEPLAKVDVVDLRVEQAAMRKMILEGVRRFASQQSEQNHEVYEIPVTGIVVGFDVANGYASVHFDVRSPFEIDGSYSHQDFAALPRENWRQFVERIYDGEKVKLKGLDGKAIKLNLDHDTCIDEAFGRMILNLVEALRVENAFAPLQSSPDAELIIEGHNASFNWSSRENQRDEKST